MTNTTNKEKLSTGIIVTVIGGLILFFIQENIRPYFFPPDNDIEKISTNEVNEIVKPIDEDENSSTFVEVDSAKAIQGQEKEEN
ncbi:MAG: hypothetical protein KDE33_29925, partial [Bacteroidetes bacterium]|nr:hypothetical protein [Bacteroidota bacterium]